MEALSERERYEIRQKYGLAAPLAGAAFLAAELAPELSEVVQSE